MSEYPQADVPKALDYLIHLHDLLYEVQPVGWDGVKAAHGEVLRNIEQGRLKWDDVSARSKILSKVLRRELLVARLKAESDLNSGSQNQSTPQLEKRLCLQYQDQTCPEAGAHVSDGIYMMHFCATCWRVKHQKYSHPKAGCRRQKSLESRNKAKNE